MDVDIVGAKMQLHQPNGRVKYGAAAAGYFATTSAAQ
jgi:hypothetical protein